MPTTPNPTPPTAEPGTGDDTPAPPVYDTTKPDMVGMYAEALKTSIGYVDHDYSSSRRRSPYYSSPAVVSVPGIAVFDGVCPGRWSRRYYSVQDAAALTGGSGYFGYDTPDLNSWWSTNFRDDGDAGSYMVKYPGTYYSKNVTVADDTVLMGAITVEGSTVKLKWGSSWGTVTRNACFDYLDSTYNYVYQSTTIPRQTDGKVDVTQLNLSVMKYAPGRGCFVMFDLASNQVLYTMLDGEQEQLPWSPSAGAPAPSLQSRDATDPGSLPLTSRLIGLPTMARGTVSAGQTATSWESDITARPDRTRVWAEFATSVWTNEAFDNPQVSTLASAQSNAPMFVMQGSGSFAHCHRNYRFRDDPGSGTQIFSGWIRPGKPTQIVGWLSGKFFFTSPWGWTSIAPSASIQGVSDFLVQSSDVRDNILSRMPNSTGVHIGFVYDASIGSYGKVTWISQL